MNPTCKWAGGKRQLLPQLRYALPEKFAGYFEPFVGGGALFFDREPRFALIGDMNARLMRMYAGVRDSVEDVIRLLQSYRYEKQFFLDVRATDIDAYPDADVAAWFIYLNRTCFNGIYRVNRSGRFNVPFGRYENPTICDEPLLRAASKALQGVTLYTGDFSHAVEDAEEGDFVYFDPPYVPLSATSSFSAYTAEGFGPDEQKRLRDLAVVLSDRGVYVLLSNSSAPLARDLYAGSPFHVTEVQASRSINSKGEKRGKISELLISTYPRD